MRKRNKVSQLNKTASHRRAMMRNMVTSLFEHERITTTRAKGKVLRVYAEKLITRARKTIVAGSKPESIMHNRREILREVRSEVVANKLVAEIAPRFKDRNGGYIRIIHLPERLSDSSQMSIVELVDRKVEDHKPKAPEKSKAKPKGTKDSKGKAAGTKVAKDEKEKDIKKGGRDDEGKWYDRFRKKKRES